MIPFDIHSIETAPDASRALLEAQHRRLGFIPNLHGVLAAAPAALQAYLSLGEIFGASRLSPVEKQVVLLAASVRGGCEYCVAAHGTVATAAKMPPHVLAALREARTIDDARLEALRRFTERVVDERGRVGEAAVGELLAAGYDRGHVLEVLVGVAMKVLSNYANHIAGTPVDEAFAGQRWTAPAV